MHNLTYNEMIVKIKNIELYTENFGEKTNPAVLLISGAMSSGHFWTDQFCKDLASTGYFVIRYDHRDMGLSTSVNFEQNPYTLADLTKDAISILDAYKIEKAHIAGHSMGGAIAQSIAIDYPSRVLSITPMSSMAIGKIEFNEDEKKILNHVWTVVSVNKPTDKFEESLNGFMKAYMHFHGDLPVDDKVAYEYIKDMYHRSKPEHLAWFKKYSAGTDPMHNHVKAQQNLPDRVQELTKITCPVFIIQGEKDNLCFARIARNYIAKHTTTAKLFIIPGMGHMVLSNNLFKKICDLFIENFRSIK